MASQFFNLAEVMGQVDLARQREQQIKSNEFEMQNQQRQYERQARMDAENEANRGAVAENQQFERKLADLDYQVKLSKYAGNAMASATPQTWPIIKQDLIGRGVKAAEAMPDTFDPDFQGKFLMNSESFIKQSGGGGDEDNLVIPTPDGLMYFNKKNKKDFGYIEQNGKRVMRSQDDAPLQGAVAGSKARATGDYKINTDIDGTVATDTQVADLVSGNPDPSNARQPSPPDMQIPPNVQTQRDDKRLQILLAEQTNIGGPGKDQYLDAEIATMGGNKPAVGLKVPTKAEQAASAQVAKDQAEFNSPENIRKRNQALEFKKTTGNNMIKVLDDVTGRVGKLTSGIGGSVLKKLPSTDAYDLNADIDTLKSNFGFDRLQAMRDMSPTGGALGSVAVQELTALQASVANLDTSQSPSQLKKNLGKAKVHYQNWLKTLEASEKTAPQKPETQATQFKAPPNPAQFNGKTIRDDATGILLKSNGKTWVRVK
jgi:hypothetical protein